MSRDTDGEGSSFPGRPPIRMVRAADREGPLFTIDELVAALRSVEAEEALFPIMHELTRGPVDAPDKTWPEDFLILIALTRADRRERIRKHLRFSREGLASAFERLHSTVSKTDKAIAPKMNASSTSGIQRLVSGADDEGDLFTADELLTALQHIHSNEDARQLASDLTEGGIDQVETAWTEGILLLVALTIPDRSERIRRHLGFSQHRMAHELASLNRSYPDR